VNIGVSIMTMVYYTSLAYIKARLLSLNFKDNTIIRGCFNILILVSKVLFRVGLCDSLTVFRYPRASPWHSDNVLGSVYKVQFREKFVILAKAGFQYYQCVLSRKLSGPVKPEDD